ncbi:WAT1-related protein At1g43650-like isoform X2 [Cornus florida]|uniref:WAT1-related protein At1g43650-like isoform X2 n=1 Tax=Cornus florida TaxID=4283 RepID=UPI0028A2A05B|nr:WAT1-related protein At1g43650-like isoform X2 [Cornus florida]
MKSSLGFPICVNKNKAYIGIILIQFINAGTALLSKAALVRGMNSYVFVFYRNAVATLVLAPFAFFLESNKSAPLSYNLLCKIFFVALVGFTVCLNLFNFALKYTTATYASASMNTIPAITFIMAVFSRMERISLRQWYGRAKVLGSMMVLSGAMVIILVKGPPIYSGTQKGASNASINHISRGNWIKGCLIMLSANITWSTWLILQAPIVKQYPSTLRLATLQYFFSSIQSAIWAVAMDRKISSWKLGWDVNLISVLFCVGLSCFSDADYDGSKTDRRSTFGFCTFYGDYLISWKSKKQPIVSRSSAEDEYRAMAQGHNCHWNWILVASLDRRQEGPCFRCYVHSIIIYHNSHLFSIIVE